MIIDDLTHLFGCKSHVSCRDERKKKEDRDKEMKVETKEMGQ